MYFVGKVGIVCTIVAVAAVAEPSVYGKNSGLYASDKMIAKNKKTIIMLQQKIAQQNERIDGLMSIVEGLSATVNTLKNAEEASASTTNTNDESLLKKLGEMIDKINANYVNKSELKAILEGKKISIDSSVNSPKVSKAETNQTDDLSHKSNKKLYSEGVRLFVKKRYDEAKKRFILTDTNGYKTAATNYYLGEIAYYTKQYEDAIFFFKKSAGLYDKASYIDVLLLHTAISLEKRGEKEQAKAFYENIIENYEGKKTASIARTKLKNL